MFAGVVEHSAFGDALPVPEGLPENVATEGSDFVFGWGCDVGSATGSRTGLFSAESGFFSKPEKSTHTAWEHGRIVLRLVLLQEATGGGVSEFVPLHKSGIHFQFDIGATGFFGLSVNIKVILLDFPGEDICAGILGLIRFIRVPVL